MRAPILLLGALTLGCDDPEVAAAAAAILEHGIVAAKVDCVGTFSHPDGTRAYAFSAAKMIDGSALMTARVASNSATKLCARSEGCSTPAASVQTNGAERVDFSVTAGELTIVDPVISGPSDTPDVVDVEASCTGFNLEAFGVE
jgi:hypothetical protein